MLLAGSGGIEGFDILVVSNGIFCPSIAGWVYGKGVEFREIWRPYARAKGSFKVLYGLCPNGVIVGPLLSCPAFRARQVNQTP